jgi:hypothetical protein
MSQENKPWYYSLLSWLKDIIPTGIALVMAVFNYMRRKLNHEKLKNEQVQLEKEQLKNEIDTNKKFNGKSDSDVIKYAVEQGGRIQDKSKQKR